ncbi:hypothetical protein Pmani_033022 [Petrolisthes manimaculis]|uniref:Uncharacterized protein n=1 Tax=Petrolisthes manimaculis TaxID=1843537 RepID=A0AAE1NQL1_9EUCA|nr:hypothetical protein Pmani_033022 [Petrolisthes manimaculis]
MGTPCISQYETNERGCPAKTTCDKEGQPETKWDNLRQDEGKVNQDEGKVNQDEGKVRQDEGKVRQDEGTVRQDKGKVTCPQQSAGCYLLLNLWHPPLPLLWLPPPPPLPYPGSLPSPHNPPSATCSKEE